MSRLMACWQKRVGPLPSDINNAYHVACEPFNFYAVGCSKTYAGDCFPQRWKLVHESHWNLMGFWTAKWKFSREHVAELTSDFWSLRSLERTQTHVIDLYSENVSVHFLIYIFNNSTYICWFTYLSKHYRDRAWTNLWENCRTVMATSRIWVASFHPSDPDLPGDSGDRNRSSSTWKVFLASTKSEWQTRDYNRQLAIWGASVEGSDDKGLVGSCTLNHLKIGIMRFHESYEWI